MIFEVIITITVIVNIYVLVNYVIEEKNMYRQLWMDGLDGKEESHTCNYSFEKLHYLPEDIESLKREIIMLKDIIKGLPSIINAEFRKVKTDEVLTLKDLPKE